MTLLALLLVSTEGVAFAQGLGNPAELIPKGEFAVGAQGNWVFKQGFEAHDLKRSYSDGYKDTSPIGGADFEGDQFYMATISYGVIDQINLFAKLGLVNGGTWTDNEPGNNWKSDLGSNFTWAVGAKGKIYEFSNGLGFAASAQYLRYDNRKVNNWRSLDTGETAAEHGWNTDDNIDYWQVDAIASVYWALGRCSPYVGGRLQLFQRQLYGEMDP